MAQKKWTWSDEFNLDTMDIIFGVVIGVASLSTNWFLGYIGPMIVALGPIGNTIVSFYAGLRYVIMFVAGYLRNKPFVTGIAVAVAYVIRTFTGGFDIGYIGYVSSMAFLPLILIHYGNRESKWTWALGAGFGGFGAAFTNLILYSWYLQPLFKWTSDMAISILSNIFFNGWLSILISQALIRSGIVERAE
jgi:hypothetical protein